MLTENSFQRLSDPIADVALALTDDLLAEIKKIANRLIKDPDANVSEDIEAAWAKYEKKAKKWTDENLSEAYLKGIKKTNGEVPSDITADSVLLAAGAGGGGIISAAAASILSDYPRHHTIYTVFQEQAYQSFRNTRIPVVRDVQGKVRDLIIQASKSSYKNADTFTRRQLSQQMMNRFAKDNITGIRYADGRTMKLDTYSEMVARSQTGNAAREASMRRQKEYGLDLVQITQHYPTSDLCEPYQGHVYSINGTSSRYPALDDAISGGLYHTNCKHYQAPYIPGTSKLPEKELGRKENRERYKIDQIQRKNERQIRHWKRRKAGALSDKEAGKAQKYISKWQGKQRKLVDDNSFLRRKYQREQI